MNIRPVQPGDIAEVARIFVAAFPESVRHVYGDRPVPIKGFCDIYAFLARVLPRNFLVYEGNGKIQGYIVVPLTMNEIWRAAVFSGEVFVWAFSWAVGRYGISVSRALTLLSNKVLFARYSRDQFSHGYSQVLSVAVHPASQGKGIGRALVTAGLEILRSQGARTVKLEVRPDNDPAKHIYTSLGFRQVGISRDSQGEWIVMIAKL